MAQNPLPWNTQITGFAERNDLFLSIAAIIIAPTLYIHNLRRPVYVKHATCGSFELLLSRLSLARRREVRASQRAVLEPYVGLTTCSLIGQFSLCFVIRVLCAI